MSEYINPADCKPDEVYIGTAGGNRYGMTRSRPNSPYPWVLWVPDTELVVSPDSGVSDLVRMVPVHDVKRGDLSSRVYDPAEHAAQQVWEPWWSAEDAQGKLTESAREALRPIRAVLDQLATDTEPPCEHVVYFKLIQDAISALSPLVYREDELTDTTEKEPP